MKAAVCYEVGKPLMVEEIDIEPPQKSEVKVRFAATAICHSDIHMLQSKGRYAFPLLGGHESAGYVQEVGEDVTSVKLGDPVVVSLLASCGQCYYCLSGFPHLCTGMVSPNMVPSHLKNKKGQVITPMARVGGFAEYGVVHQSQVVKIPKDIPMDRAALLA